MNQQVTDKDIRIQAGIGELQAQHNIVQQRALNLAGEVASLTARLKAAEEQLAAIEAKKAARKPKVPPEK